MKSLQYLIIGSLLLSTGYACSGQNKNQAEAAVADVNQTKEVEEPLTAVYNSYFSLKDALVKTDEALASTNAKKLLEDINKVQTGELSEKVGKVWSGVLTNLKKDAEYIAKTKNIENQRERFVSLSKNLYEVAKNSKQESPIYYQLCPMANDGKGATWLSREKTIKNPYYGSQMLSCGSVVEELD